MLKLEAGRIVDDLANRIINTISPTKLVVGLSGGADSTLVLLVARRVQELNPDFSVLAVHCIHGLDADDPIWLTHCITLCNRVGVRLLTPKLNIVYGFGRSPEEVSRSERYNALIKNIKDGGVLLLGHQADDQVESFFLSLKRGSGPYGLSGMRYYLNDERGCIIRPLLELTKAQVIDVIEALGYSHVFDISNTYLKFERNFIRLKVLPLLRERFKGVDNAVLRSQKLCSYEHDLAERYTKEIFFKQYDKDSQSFDFENLDLNDLPLLTSLVRMFVKTKEVMPPEFTIVNEIISLMRGSPDQDGRISLERCSVRRFRNRIYLVEDTIMPDKGIYEIKSGESIKLGDYLYTLKGDDMKGSYLLDFTYSGSKVIKPVNRNHSREIKKLFTEYEIPVFRRRALPLVIEKESNEVLLFANLAKTRDIRLRLEIELTKK